MTRRWGVRWRSVNGVAGSPRWRRSAQVARGRLMRGRCPVTPVPPPFLFDELRGCPNGDVVVAIRDLRYYGTSDAGMSLVDQPLQFSRSRRQRLALGIELLAIVE